MEVTLTKKDGQIVMEHSFDYLTAKLANGVYTLSIKRKTKPRTISQNALMWMWFKCMEESTGTPKEDFHDYYKAKYLGRNIELRGRLVHVIGSTTELNTLQMTDYLNKIQSDAAVEFGITLPLPADRHYQSFIDEYRNR